jgi:hypothetical protein
MKWLVFLLALSSVALVCDFDSNPIIEKDFTLPFLPDDWQFAEDKIYWHCYDESIDYSCVVAVHDGNLVTDGIIQVNPDIEDIKNYGRVSTFESDGQINTVYLRAESGLIQPAKQYLVGVHCGNETNTFDYSGVITPQYRDLDAAVGFGVAINQNMGSLIMGIFFFVVVILIGLLVWRAVKWQ